MLQNHIVDSCKHQLSIINACNTFHQTRNNKHSTESKVQIFSRFLEHFHNISAPIFKSFVDNYGTQMLFARWFVCLYCRRFDCAMRKMLFVFVNCTMMGGNKYLIATNFHVNCSENVSKISLETSRKLFVFVQPAIYIPTAIHASTSSMILRLKASSLDALRDSPA